jgi:brevianamide F synthase
LAFWRKYLKGASVTRLEPSQALSKEGSSTVVIATAEVPFLPTPPVGITLATLIKAAWAVVLSRRTGQTDVVFGQTVNGRNLPLVGIDQILGPCVNFVPFRVHLRPNCTVRELLDRAQAQYLLTTDHDDIPLGQIIGESTSWSAGEGQGLPLIFQHQNVQHQFHLAFGKGKDNDELTSTSYEPDLHVYPLSEDWVFSAPYETKLKLQMVGLELRVSFEVASCMMRELAGLVEGFARFPDGIVSSLL